jgi:galactose oxidase-like protein/Kelch motif protein
MSRLACEWQIALILACCAGLAACGGSSTPVVTAIAIATAQPSIPVSGVASFTATATDKNGRTIPGVTFSFVSSVPTVAGVTAPSTAGASVNGLLPGTTQISASSGGVTSNVVTVTVTPGFLSTGSLAAARSNATATVLNNGKVLIAGGTANNTSLSEAELFDPSTNTFTATGSLVHARNSHFAVLLANGNVLVGGGFDGANFLSSAEIYNPSTGTFTATGNLVTARRLAAVGVLENGKVLIAGGEGANGFLAAAELYNPVDGTFTSTGSLGTARSLTTATVAPSGVVIAGGLGASADLSSVEIYLPQYGRFILAGGLQVPRSYHTATLLSDGNILIAGGVTPDDTNTSVALASAEIFNPFTFTSTLLGANLNTARLGATATLQSNGTVLIAGGDTTNSTGRVAVNSAEIFDPVASQFSATGPLETARAGQTATLLPNGNTLIVGGADASGSTMSAEIYEPGSFNNPSLTKLGVFPLPVTFPLIPSISPNAHTRFAAGADAGSLATGPVAWSSSDATMVQIGNDATNPGIAAPVTSPTTTQTVTISGAIGNLSATSTLTVRPAGFLSVGSMSTAREFHTATALLNGFVLVVEGDGGALGTPAPAELYFPVIDAFRPTGTPVTRRLNHTATLLQNGQVLITGGVLVSNSNQLIPLASAELYDPNTGLFTATGSMAQARYDHAAMLLNNGMVLISGGMTSDSDFLSSAELYNPATGAFTTANSLNVARGQHTATRLADGTVLIAGGQGAGGAFVGPGEIYDPATGEFTKTGNVITPRTAHTATLLSNGSVLLAGGVEFTKFGSTSAEIFNPVSRTFAATGSLITGRDYHAATLLGTGMVLITGGIIGQTATITASAELFNPASGTFSATAPMNSARAQHTAALLDDGTVLITGGVNGQTVIASAEIY